MKHIKRKSFQKIATVFIAISATLGSTSHAEAALLGPSSNYIIQISPATREAIESAIKNAGGTINARYQYAFDGFVVKLPDLLLPILKKIPNILTIEKDQPVSSLAIQQNQTPTPSWGIDRIDQREILSTATGYQGTFGYRSAGAGSTIYIGDTGIYPHNDLAGRISTNGFSGIADGNGTIDCNGHGTHVATTAAGTQFGVAKKANVVPVRILNCAGSGSYSTVIAGLDWIMSPLNTNSKSQAVVNLSIGGPVSSSLNDAIRRLTNAGITVVAAAGNENSDACTRSPASAPSAITVGATTISDSKASYSNWGPCVDIHAPGSAITGGWISAPTSTNTINGTSMATPHVTGAAAVFLGLNPTASVAQVADALASQSTKGAVQGLSATTVNNLLYISPTDGGPAIVAPTAQITTITEITHLQAKVMVEINPSKAPTTASLQYSTDANFTSIIRSVNLTPSAIDGGLIMSIPAIVSELTPNTTYFIRVTASNESGSFTTETSSFKSLAPPVSPPMLVSLAPTSITGWSARLNGTVNANNGTTTVSFLYGTDPDFITNTQTGLADPQSVSGNTVRNVGLDISFLSPLTTYYYKVVGSNSAASVHSEVISFTTPAIVGVAPTVETLRPAGGLNTPSTTISARLNPMGQTTSVRLVYGSEQSLSISPRIVNVATQYTGDETVTVTADMSGLVPGYRYYYRFEATNAAGVTKSVALTNTGNPLMPVISNTMASNQTQSSLLLQTRVNPGASNTRTYFIFGTDPLLESGTSTVQGTPFALTNAISNQVSYSLTGLKPNTTIYFRAKVIAYTGPLAEQGGSLLGPIVSAQTLMPERTPQTITFTLPSSRQFVAAPTPLTATASSGLPVTYKTTTPTICQIVVSETETLLTSVTPIPALNGAACNVVASQNGDDTFAPAVSIGRTINFLKKSQVITFATPANRDLSTPNPLTASSNSGLPVTFTSSTPATCSVVATDDGGFAARSVAGIAADVSRCTILATQPGDDFYSSISSSRTFTWTRTSITVKAKWATPVTVEGSMLEAQVTDYRGNILGESATGTSPLTFTSLTPKVCKIRDIEYIGDSSIHSRSVVSALWNGSCQISIGFAGNSTYASGALTTALAISGITTPEPGASATQSITITSPSTSTFGSVLAISAKSTSGLPVILTTTTPEICILAQETTGGYQLSAVTGLTGDNNSCQISANQVGDERWAPARTTTRSILWKRPVPVLKSTWIKPFSVDGSDLHISLTDIVGKSLEESVTGRSPIEVSSLTPKVCTVTSAEYQGSGIAHTTVRIRSLWNGICQVTARYAGSPYLSGVGANIYQSISGITSPGAGANATQSIAFMPQSSAPSGTVIPLIAKATSKLPVTITTSTPLICNLTENQDGSFTVTSSSNLRGDTNNCILVANQKGNESWAAAPTITRTIRFTRALQSISFTLSTSRFYGGSPTALSATSSSGLPVTFSTTTPNVCRVDIIDSSSVLSHVLPVTSTSSATCYVVASQAGDERFSPAPSITRYIQFRKESTSIFATWSGPITTSGTTVDFIVKSSSQPLLNESIAGTSPLTVTTSTPNICQVINSSYIGSSTSHTQVTVKAMWNGNCRLTATFNGNSYWLSSSSSESRGITGMVQPEPGANVSQTIYISSPSSLEIGALASLTVSTTSKLVPTVKSLTPTICEVSRSGNSFLLKSAPDVTGNGNTCTLEASQAGDDRWQAAKTISRTITINKAAISVRLSWLSTTLNGKTPASYRVENRYVNAALNQGLNSIGHISTFVSNTPAICSVGNVSALTVSGGTYTQATVTGLANGTCSITYGFAGDETRLAAYRTQLISVIGIK